LNPSLYGKETPQGKITNINDMKIHPTMWAEKIGHELYVFWRGKIIYKSWLTKSGKKTQPSVLFNEKWPNEEIT